MSSPLPLLLAVGAALLGAGFFWQRRVAQRLERERRVREWVLPNGLFAELAKIYPQLTDKDAQLVARALRQWFLIHLRAPRGVIVMPSKAVDALWHAFILNTRAYAAFCHAAFGGYFHHIPESEMARQPNDGWPMWRTWRLACKEENINPNAATRVPLLFAIDAKLQIPGARIHDPRSFQRPAAGDGGCAGGCGGGDSGGCGGDGGCGGGGCGGGGD